MASKEKIEDVPAEAQAPDATDSAQGATSTEPLTDEATAELSEDPAVPADPIPAELMDGSQPPAEEPVAEEVPESGPPEGMEFANRPYSFDEVVGYFSAPVHIAEGVREGRAWWKVVRKSGVWWFPFNFAGFPEFVEAEVPAETPEAQPETQPEVAEGSAEPSE